MNFHEGSEQPRFEHNPLSECMLRLYGSEFLFSYANAQAWIDTIRAETEGALDIHATAQNVGVPVEYEMPIVDGERVFGKGMIRGLGDKRGIEPFAIHLDPKRAVDEHDLTFGHELGHLFLDNIGIESPTGGRDVQIEAFCEFFGRQMVLPVERLQHLGEVTEATIFALMDQYDTRHTTVIYQLMAAKKLPRRILFDTGIGEAENEFYSGKVRRHCACLDCDLAMPHGLQFELEVAPTLNLTDYNLSDTSPMHGCSGSRTQNIEEFIALNKLHGRWKDTDDALVPRELAREAEIREVMAKVRIDLTQKSLDDRPF